MAHQRQLERPKYRNWVKGGLAYKYLKDGIEKFADKVVQQDHMRIISGMKHSPALPCNQCSLNNLKPLHKHVYDPSDGKEKCPWGQNRCNCLFQRKRGCRNHICDEIVEDILKSHGSCPPTPNWKNTNIQNWFSVPWEVAKCFINAPGYSDKMSAPDIDAPGLLHIFINNINYQDRVTGTDVFIRVLKRRNTIFHSPTMELEDKELNDCIDDIVAILEDEKELEARADAQQAVIKLKQLKHDNFIITTYNEVDVCRAAMSSIVIKETELKQLIQETKTDIDTNKADIESKQKDLLLSMDAKAQTALAGASEVLSRQSDSKLKTVKQTMNLLEERVKQLELDNANFKERLAKIEGNIERLDEARNSCQIQLEHVEKKQVLQKKLAELYLKHYVKTSVNPLKMQDNDIDMNEVYVKPNMSIMEKCNTKKVNKKRKLDTEILYSRDNRKDNEASSRNITRYREIFQTDGLRHQSIYIVGDVGTGKSSLAKIMIYNWCIGLTFDEDNKVQDEYVEEMRFFEFLFFIPLQKISGFSGDIPEMVKILYKDVVSVDLISRLFAQESKRCLIIADGLDEWTPPRQILPQHVSFGIPNRDGIQNATLLTLSRPSAKGILNLKSSEYDLKIELSGVNETSIRQFTEKYMFQLQTGKTCTDGFMQTIRQSNLQHLQKTPLLLQQLIWMYYTEGQIGNSMSDIYGNILNGMLCWSEQNDDGSTSEVFNTIPKDFEEIQLPGQLKKYPRCDTNKRFILQLGQVAFDAYIEDTWSSTFSRSKLIKCGLSKSDIAMLVRLGILAEYKSFDPKYDDTFLSFIHVSYLEFCAAVYISSRYDAEQTKELKEKGVLEELFQEFTTVADILQLSNLLKFVCGLSPYLITKISKVFSEIAKGDERMIRYRINLRDQYNPDRPYETIREPQLFQQLLYNCLTECGTIERHEISLCDVCFSYRTRKDFIRLINPKDILSVYIELYSKETFEEVTELINQLTNVQYIVIKMKNPSIFWYYSFSLQHLQSIKYITLKSKDERFASIGDQLRSQCIDSCQIPLSSVGNAVGLKDIYISDLNFNQMMCEELCELVSKAISLEHIELKRISCYSSRCSGHTMDLSRHYYCQSIHIEQIPWLTDLKVCPEGELKEYEKYLEPTSQTRSFIHIRLGDVNIFEHRTLGFSNSEILRSIHIENCPVVPSFLKYTKNVQDIYIEGGRRGKHELCEILSSVLLHSVSLTKVTLKDIYCSCSNCRVRTIDFSNHGLLGSIHFENVPFVPSFLKNTTNLHEIYISFDLIKGENHKLCETLTSLLLHTVSLTKVTLKDIYCSCSNCSVETIDFSNYELLRSIHFETVPFVPSFLKETTNLHDIYISGDWIKGKRFGVFETLAPPWQTESLTEVTLKVTSNLHDKYISGDQIKGRNHDICEILSSSLIYAVSLSNLTLEYIICSCLECTSRVIDLSNHKKLQSIHFKEVSLIPTCPNTLNELSITFDPWWERGLIEYRIKHELCEQLLSSLPETVALQKLKLDHISCNQIGCQGHYLDLSQLNQLRSFDLNGRSIDIHADISHLYRVCMYDNILT